LFFGVSRTEPGETFERGIAVGLIPKRERLILGLGISVVTGLSTF